MANPLYGKSQIMRTDESVTVTRKGVVKYVDGKPSYPSPTRFQLIGAVQPLNGRELLLVPEGDRFKEQYWVFTQNDIRVNDIVTRCGANYQVQAVEDWRSYRRARIMRLDVGPDRTP